MRKFFRQVTTTLITLALLLSCAAAAVAADYDDQETARVPVRAFFEEAGAEVLWDNDERSIIITLEPNEYVLFAFSSAAYINGEPVVLQYDVIIIDDRSYIAADDLLLLLGAETGYLGGTISTTLLTVPMYMELLSIPGVTVAIIDAGEGFTWLQGFGYADVSEEKPVTEYTLFNLASISKSFTAVAVMQLAEAGVIDLDEPVATYLPDFMLPADMETGTGDYRNITPRMLLSHASGIHADIMASGVLSTGSANPAYMDGFLELIAKFPMDSPEATEYSYSNNAYTLLGILVAELTGAESYYDGFVSYTDEFIFGPAGMEMTTFALSDDHIPYLARPYHDALTEEEFLYYNALPAGGIFSNASDMARFMHIILSGGESQGYSLLSEEYADLMFEVQDYSFEGLHIMAPNRLPGMGFLHSTGLNGFELTGHPGNMVHYHSSMVFDRDTGLGVFVSVNSISGIAAPEELAAGILQTAVFEKTGDIKLPESDFTVELAELSAEDMQAIAGLYSIIGGESLSHIVIADDVLYLPDFPGIPFPLALIPLSDGSFINPDTLLRFWFVEIQGNITLFLGEFKTHFVGGKLNPEVLQADDGVGQWIGVYEPVTEDGFPSLFSRAEVGIDENGIAFIRLLALHDQVSFSVLSALGDGVYLGGLKFSADGDDIILEFSGVTMKMVAAHSE